MLRTGIVQEGKGGQVRVVFEDENIVSPWLDVLVTEAKGAQALKRPRAGNMVRVLMDERSETGVVLGAIYSEADPAPEVSDVEHVHIYADGTRIAYDEASGTMSFSNAAGLAFTLSGSALVVQGNVQIDGDLTVSGQTKLQGTTINGISQQGD